MEYSSSMGTGTDPPHPHPTPPHPHPTPSHPTPRMESLMRRSESIWRILLGVNFAVAAYLLMGKKKKKDVGTVEAIVPVPPISISTSTPAAAVVITEYPVTPPPTMEPVPCSPIPEEQQRKLYIWLLEEKRKVKPRDREEKKRIDKDKAILKQFIRAKSIPNL